MVVGFFELPSASIASRASSKSRPFAEGQFLSGVCDRPFLDPSCERLPLHFTGPAWSLCQGMFDEGASASEFAYFACSVSRETAPCRSWHPHFLSVSSQ